MLKELNGYVFSLDLISVGRCVCILKIVFILSGVHENSSGNDMELIISILGSPK